MAGPEATHIAIAKRCANSNERTTQNDDELPMVLGLRDARRTRALWLIVTLRPVSSFSVSSFSPRIGMLLPLQMCGCGLF